MHEVAATLALSHSATCCCLWSNLLSIFCWLEFPFQSPATNQGHEETWIAPAARCSSRPGVAALVASCSSIALTKLGRTVSKLLLNDENVLGHPPACYFLHSCSLHYEYTYDNSPLASKPCTPKEAASRSSRSQESNLVKCVQRPLK